jgi:hypothetical protein
MTKGYPLIIRELAEVETVEMAEEVEVEVDVEVKVRAPLGVCTLPMQIGPLWRTFYVQCPRSLVDTPKQ